MNNSNYATYFANLANAEKNHDAQLVAGVSVKHWSMEQDNKITYQKDDSHTLSIYLNGGTRNYRCDKASTKGAPGKICLMPQGESSQWEIDEKVEFVHLYFTDQILKQHAASSFGMDVRFIELKDLLFQNDEVLQNLFASNFLFYRNSNAYSPLFAEQAMNEVMHHLLKSYNSFQVRESRITGGLSPNHLRITREMILDRLSEKLSIEKLADQVNLSPFHFARMFKISFGESPANFITRSRVDAVKLQLQTQDSLANVSLSSGFSQQSHMTSHFKKLTKMTPGAYRHLINKTDSLYFRN